MHHVPAGASRWAGDGDKTSIWPATSRGSGREGVASMARPSVTNTADADAVVFSIQFYGKTIGEVGLMDQDLSQLDWQRFKSYIFQNLLSMNNQENICISYSDDEGDKLPIESEEEYREALKVAKKKAEAHDKLVLDLTRQGGLPTVFSIVSSGIKRVSSSPPKEGGISFFKTASPPKESSGFMARSSAPDRNIFSSFFSSDRSEGEMLDGGTRPKETGRSCEQPPEWFSSYMDKFREELCEDVVTKLANMMREQHLGLEADKEEANNEYPQVEFRKSTLNWKSSRAENTGKGFSQPMQNQSNCPAVCSNFWTESGPPRDYTRVPAERDITQRRQRKSGNLQKRSSFQISFTDGKGSSKENTSDAEGHSQKKEDLKEVIKDAGSEVSNDNQKTNSFQFVFTEGNDISKEKTPDEVNRPKKKEREGKEMIKSADVGVKRKKNVKEDERFSRWIEKMEEKMARKQGKMEERFIKKHEKLEERLVKKQEKLVERFQKQQEKAEKKKPTSRLSDMEKNMRTQGKVLAKMEGLRKKQTCSAEELSKLRKVVDRHHRVAEKHEGMALDQRQLRRSERKAGGLKLGKPRKIDLDAKAFPVDPSLLHKALLELESLAEGSLSESNSSATLGYDAFYVRDITYPDGSRVSPGAKFVKTWRVLNSGLMPWNEKTELCKWTQVQFHGSPMGWKLKPLEKKVTCPPLKPGECGNISITFIAPNEPGWYATHWKFCQHGRVFGNQIWCAVHVVSNTDADPEAQATGVTDKTESEDTEGSALEDRDQKECSETGTLDKSSSLPQEKLQLTFRECFTQSERRPDYTSIGLTPDGAQATKVESPTHEEQVLEVPEYEVGIIENYYDAEDPAEESVEHPSGVNQDNTTESPATVKTSTDLITFEEEAELVFSRSSSPDIIPRTHHVIPLKDIAKESVDSLRDYIKAAAVEKDEKRSCDVLSEPYSLDELSISSGSFSDLDSEDQAILDESDTDSSDQDYFVVNMPECFDLTHPYSGTLSVTQPGSSQATVTYPDAERHDSPDFLTADEDDRTAAAAYNCVKYQDESMINNNSNVKNNESINQAGTTVDPMVQSSALESKSPKVVPSLPLPPTDTKGFMDIPPEALRTNLALSLYKENAIRPEAEQQQQQQETGQANWGSGREERQEVVCEQPVSAQVKAGSSPRSQTKSSLSGSADGDEGSSQGTPTATAATPQEQPPGDGAAALPDELVSIIPEDLVRGVWNTARTFITRINQEMLSPSASGPEKEGDEEGDAKSASPPPHSIQEPSQQEEGKEPHSAATPEAREEPSLPPPLQQLADMGFSNLEVNQRLLTKYNNDVACAVAELIVLNCQ